MFSDGAVLGQQSKPFKISQDTKISQCWADVITSHLTPWMDTLIIVVAAFMQITIITHRVKTTENDPME